MNYRNIDSSITDHKGGERTLKYISKNIISKYLIANFFKSINDLIKLSNPYSIHEVGCGEGHIIASFVDEQYSILGSDISQDCLDIAKRMLKNRSNIKLINQDIYDLNKDNHSADLVICCEVLEHLDDPKKAMEALLSITNKNLIVSVPREPLWRLLNILRLTYLKNLGNTPGHLNHWSKKSFIAFISDYMDVISIKSPLPWTLLLCKPKS